MHLSRGVPFLNVHISKVAAIEGFDRKRPKRIQKKYSFLEEITRRDDNQFVG